MLPRERTTGSRGNDDRDFDMDDSNVGTMTGKTRGRKKPKTQSGARAASRRSATNSRSRKRK